jgi:hypothetical protein
MKDECKQCLLNSFEGYLQNRAVENKMKDQIMFRIRAYIEGIRADMPTPEVARVGNQIMASSLKNDDLFEKEKRKSNDIVLKRYAELKDYIHLSSDPFNLALRLSIAGNILDFVSFPALYEKGSTKIDETIDFVLRTDFAIDDSKELKKNIQSSKTLLYLGDNAGEIVLDKLFLETINHPNVYYAVRGGPVINDVTLTDAFYVGINYLARLISNGYDAPSTIIEKSSKNFLDVYQKADLIISKGQGNYEGLMMNERSDLFYLLMVKCNVIAEILHVKKGDFVVKRNRKPKI